MKVMAHQADVLTAQSVGQNIWNPQRIASCTCGWHGKGTLKEVNILAEAHVAEGCEGCDHAIFIESSVLDDKERH